MGMGYQGPLHLGVGLGTLEALLLVLTAAKTGCAKRPRSPCFMALRLGALALLDERDILSF